ncbi:DUF11 domain-containing protein [Deinococcus sp. HMF7620]|uniref:DUF11 domain-containing protein n=1 Tax=Deinococcus arboris TaxID=2682977 RepID=A0A7C9I583_9DEIO|nr:DUF11 domain-containing protein [Deinococcus arboris]MVN88731.1 DUF11 domain-containing protein [Deinococcus arboris]
MRARLLSFITLLVLLVTIGRAQAGPCAGGACVVAGPRLLSVDSGRSAVLSPLLQGLLGGGSVTLTAADWTAVAQTDVRLSAFLNLLQAQVGAGTVQDALNADISVATLLEVAAQAAETDGATAAASALRALALGVPGLTGTLRLGELLQLDFPPGAFVDSRLNLLSLVLGGTQLFNTRNAVTTGSTPITLSGVSVNLSGLGLGVGTVTPTIQAFVQVIEPPVYRCGPQGATFHAASIRVKLDVNFNGLTVNLLNPSGVDTGLDLTLTNLNLYLEVARASGAIGLVDAVSDAVTLNVTPGVARLALGTIPDSTFFNRSVPNPFTSLTPARVATTQVSVAGLGLLNLDVNARGLADGTPGAQAVTFSGPYPQTRTVQSGFVGVTSLVTSLVDTLSVGVRVSAGQTVPPALQGTVDATIGNLLAPATSTLKLVLRPTLLAVLTALGDRVLDLLGTGIGQAVVTVTGVNTVCTLTGRVYSDLQPDGVADAGESWPGPTVRVNAVLGGAVVASAPVPAGPGTYTLAVPEGSVVALVTTSAAGITPAAPAGFVFVNPLGGQAPLTVAATATSLPDLDFGLFAGDRLSGTLFRDDGRGGALPHDALAQGSEAGLAGLTVSVTGSGGTRSTVTAAGGAFTLYVPGSWTDLSLTPPAPQPGLDAVTGVRVDGAVTLATDPQGTGLRPAPLPDPVGQVRTVSLGLTGRPTLTPNGAGRTEAPATLTYAHTFRPGTVGTLTFNLGAGGTALAADRNCDGTLDAAERAAGTSALVVGDSWPRDPDGRLSACALEVTVAVSAGTAPGTVLTTPLGLSLTWQDRPVTDAAGATDTTTVLPGATVGKTVENLTRGTPAGLSTDAQPGDRLRYCLTVTNGSPDPLSTLTLSDTLAGAALYAPGSLTLGGTALTDAADADAGEVAGRTVTYRIAGLAPQASVAACLDVTVP